MAKTHFNKFAIVTGASTGIGRATAIQLAKRDAHIALVARTKQKLAETKKLIEAAGGTADIFPTDLANAASINQLIDSIKSATKQVNFLVNIAGIWHSRDEVFADRDFANFPQQVILDTISVGTTAPMLLAHAFIPLMPSHSKIINLSGTFENGAKGWLPYYVSKKAIEDLTVGLSEELKDKNIQVNGVSPSDTATQSYKKYFPQYLDESIDPKEIAKFIVKLCSDDSITGKIFVLKKDQQPFTNFHY